MTIQFDETLRPFATDKQWEAYRAVCEHGTYGAAARATGKSKGNLQRDVGIIRRRAVQQGHVPPAIKPIPDGLTLRGTSTLYRDDGTVMQQWDKTKTQGRPEEETTPLPGPITKVSKLYDGQGRVIQEWVSAKATEEQKAQAWADYARELAATVDRAAPIPYIMRPPLGDLLACYPVGDHHLGMLAWGTETGGGSYDMKISEDLLRNASTYLMRMAPCCDQALVAFLGDFLHYDSFDAVTPTGHNLLDADGRYPKMIRAGVRMMRHMVDAALERHGKVHVIVEIGNHDLSSSVFLMECLRCVYENEPRVTIDTLPSHYHYFKFGRNLIGTHHGHGTKMEKLPMIMAADRAKEWGETAHRYWWTGHIHNRTATDFAGCSVESFRILAPADAWAAQKGYRPIRDMKALVLHTEHGEVARHTVNPDMFKGA